MGVYRAIPMIVAFTLSACGTSIDRGPAIPLSEAVEQIVNALDAGQAAAQKSPNIHGLVASEAEVTLKIQTKDTESGGIQIVATPSQITGITGITGNFSATSERLSEDTIRIKYQSLLLVKNDTIAGSKSPEELIEMLKSLKESGTVLLFN